PGMNGYETAIEIRKKHNMPIMFLSAKNQDIDKIMGLDIGADDYNNRKWL
ncbi:MAG TPA: response regulator, partial [Candidatus Avanaerovorax faecigallinarum]|nr:response regulator [Candidatus Avanaerovorax faecigallinarum]